MVFLSIVFLLSSCIRFVMIFLQRVYLHRVFFHRMKHFFKNTVYITNLVKDGSYRNGSQLLAKVVYRQMSTPRELFQQIPAPPPQAKAKMQMPRVGANFWCKSPGVRGEGWLWMKLIPAKRKQNNQENFLNFVAVAIVSVIVLGHLFNKRDVF